MPAGSRLDSAPRERFSPPTAVNCQPFVVAREFRWVVTRDRGQDTDVLISTGATGDPEDTFLQVMAWDARGHFNFYQRDAPDTWFHAGTSWDALPDDTRGRGPFDSHVNGAPVMKELREPWSNWHSGDAQILGNAGTERLGPTRLVDGEMHLADVLERSVVRPAIRRWVNARLAAVTRGGVLTDARRALRQLFDTTTVNLVSAQDRSRSVVSESRLRVPREIFFNQELILAMLGLLGATLPPSLTTPPELSGEHYLAAISSCGVHLVGIGADGDAVRIPGDSLFALLTPEPAAEDIAVVRQLVRLKVLSPRFACCVALVDFPNPVFSTTRASLLAAMPDVLDFAGDADAEQGLADSIAALGTSAAAEFSSWWAMEPTDFIQRAVRVLDAYMTAVRRRLGTAEGTLDLVRLVSSRRRQFQDLDLHEFCLTVPFATTPQQTLGMAADGRVREIERLA